MKRQNEVGSKRNAKNIQECVYLTSEQLKSVGTYVSMPTARRVSVSFGETTPPFPAEGNVFVRYLKAIILYQTSTTLRKNLALPPCFLNI